MTIKLDETYTGRVDTTDPDYQWGKGRNIQGGVPNTGTPFDEKWFNDFEGNKQALLRIAGIVPSGVSDSAVKSDQLEAMKRVQRGFLVGNPVGSFRYGFKYTSANDVGIDNDGNFWKYTGAGSYPITVAADTDPTSGDFTQAYARDGQINPVGNFSDGVTFNFPNDAARDAGGEYWVWTGALPYTATAGTVPSSPDYEKVFYNSASEVSTDDEESVQDYINKNLTPFDNVSAMRAYDYSNIPENEKIRWSGYYVQSDGGSNWGVLKKGNSTSLTDDGGSIFIIVNDVTNGVWIEANLKGKTLNLRKFGVLADGVNVESTQFQRAVTNADHVRLSGGTLLIDSTISLHNNSHIELQDGALIKQANESNLQQLFSGASLNNISFTGVRVDFNGANQSNYAFGQESNRGRVALLSSCNKIRVYKGQVDQTFGSSYYMIDCADIKVEKWKAFDNEGHFNGFPIYGIRCQDALIRSCEMTGRRDFGGNSSSFGVLFKDSVVNIKYKSNKMLRYQMMIDGTDAATETNMGSNGHIVGNTIIDPIADTTIRFMRYGTIRGNTVRGSGDYGISVGDSEGISVTSNNVENSNTVGIGIRKSPDCVVSNNTVKDPCTNFKGVSLIENQRNGIYVLGDSRRVIVTANSVTDFQVNNANKMFHAIRVEDFAAGVKGDDNSSAIIGGNTCYGAKSGIDIYADGEDNVLLHNFRQDGKDPGVRLGNEPFYHRKEGDLRNNAVLKKPTYYDGTQECALPKIVPVPANSSSVGKTGDIAFNSSYLYICNSENSWRRVALETF